jgi:hypothetical protein
MQVLRFYILFYLRVFNFYTPPRCYNILSCTEEAQARGSALIALLPSLDGEQ